MAYTISSDTVGLAVGPVSETANDVHEALSKARQMYEDGLANVAIADETERRIDGDELLACLRKAIAAGLESAPIGVVTTPGTKNPKLAGDMEPTPRRFPPPWTVEDHLACFIVKDSNGQALAHIYFEEEPGRRSAAKLPSKDEARRIAANIDNLRAALPAPKAQEYASNG
jgi:hypothetical protein